MADAEPVIVTPKSPVKSLTLIVNVLVIVGAWLARPELTQLLGAMGITNADTAIAAVSSVIAGVNGLIRYFKTTAPIKGSPPANAAASP